MFGLDAILGLVGPLLPYILGVLALIGAYFGIKSKGARDERARQEAAAARSRQEAQDRVDAARDQDAVIDESVRRELERIVPSAPPERGDRQPLKPGDRFEFGWILLIGAALILGACARVTPAMAPVHVEIPARPLLPACPAIPHPKGVVVLDERGEQAVRIGMEDAALLKQYLAVAPVCWEAREIILGGHLEKLENRIRALAPGAESKPR